MKAEKSLLFLPPICWKQEPKRNSSPPQQHSILPHAGTLPGDLLAKTFTKSVTEAEADKEEEKESETFAEYKKDVVQQEISDMRCATIFNF